MNFIYEYPRPMVTTDIAVFKKSIPTVSILLIKRLNPPFQNQWALPGGFLDQDESLLDCAYRELKEETSLEGIELEQLYTFGNPGRDPRGHCVTIIYYGWVTESNENVVAGDDAREAAWFPVDKLPVLAFDHHSIIEMAIKKLHLI
jgi:8-oxo-dGTP diphosphatase